ncbi:MAG: proton-conducting transporter membrane subunit [Candidatus Omnitrophica bacterium]|nr:proton-conducting transporter membrane subunit [Candidatus Omnitrophota bacterium]
MYLLSFLIIFPLCVSLLLLLLKGQKLRNGLVKISALAISAAAISLLISTFHRSIQYFHAESHLIDKIMFFTEMALAVYILYLGIKFKRSWVVFLILLQTALMVYFENSYGGKIFVENNLFIDKFSILMSLVVGIIGSLICVYAIGYMRDFHKDYHKEIKDRTNFFFFIVFVFLSAMFGVIFSNNLLWLYFFWEITTLCSFLLIGYKKTEESRKNAFMALELNLLGGLAFLAAIVFFYRMTGSIELSKVMLLGKAWALVPAMLICFAGLTKSAQMPFSSWLLGAMVAPTPVSALLHSSTMVKAGVYIILRFAAVLQGTMAGFALALIGGVTFLTASFAAVSQSDAKKVLAYSTIANLGLIVLCAGIGTYEAMWAAILLIIFHAVAKCLLFLCVGTVEHKIHSRNIEHMSGLIISLPKISIMMQIGMAGMFLAPFGMLISKWAVLKALVDYNPLLAIFVVFGSSVTLFFWVKWMGKLIIVTEHKDEIEERISKSQWFPLTALSVLTIVICGFFPLVSSTLIEPYCLEIYARTISMSHGNIVIMSIMLAMVMLFPLSFINYGKRVKVVDAYLGGANIHNNIQFRGSANAVKSMAMHNYYLEGYFNEVKLLKFGIVISSVLVFAMLGLSLL